MGYGLLYGLLCMVCSLQCLIHTLLPMVYGLPELRIAADSAAHIVHRLAVPDACVCVCVCARARVRVRACVCVCGQEKVVCMRVHACMYLCV